MGHVEKVVTTEHHHGVHCSIGGHVGWWAMTDEARRAIGTPCNLHMDGVQGIMVEYEEDINLVHDEYVCSCGSHNAEIRYIFGIYYNIMCDACWRKDGGAERDARGFDPAYAGESLEEDW